MNYAESKITHPVRLYTLVRTYLVA